MTLALEHEPTTAERERETVIGLASVPEQSANEQLEHDASVVDHGDGGPPRPPTRGRPTRPRRPKYWVRVLYLLLGFIFCFAVGWLIGAGLDREWRRYTGELS